MQLVLVASTPDYTCDNCLGFRVVCGIGRSHMQLTDKLVHFE